MQLDLETGLFSKVTALRLTVQFRDKEAQNEIQIFVNK